MSVRNSVQQDPHTGFWHWFDETWNQMPDTYATRAAALNAQNRYVDVVLEGRNWRPKVGDYVWHGHHGLTPGCPSQIVDVVTDGRRDCVVRSLTGCQQGQEVFSTDLEPMTEMEVLAIARAWPSVIL